LAELARELLAYSDTRDAELAGRQAARADSYRVGYAEGEQAGRRAALESIAESQRQIHAELAGLPSRPAYAALERVRWELRGEVRTRTSFAGPHPGDYLGGPVAWAPMACAA
jgi:flagellar biosynthesis/type III secretory pathway protein FliH